MRHPTRAAAILDEADGPTPHPRHPQSRQRWNHRCRNTAPAPLARRLRPRLDSDDRAHPSGSNSVYCPARRVRPHGDALPRRPRRRGSAPHPSGLSRAIPGRLSCSSAPLHARAHRLLLTPYARPPTPSNARRIEVASRAAGHRHPRDISPILRSSPESLSADEFAAGWCHEARPAHKQAYTRWHEAITCRRRPPSLDPEAPRLFPGPCPLDPPGGTGGSAYRGSSMSSRGDWRRYGGPQVSMMQEITACTAAGMQVGVMHLEALRFYTSVDQPCATRCRDLLAPGRSSGSSRRRHRRRRPPDPYPRSSSSRPRSANVHAEAALRHGQPGAA